MRCYTTAFGAIAAPVAVLSPNELAGVALAVLTAVYTCRKWYLLERKHKIRVED